MAIDKYKPHLLVLPEDDANGALAFGFQETCDWPRRMRIERVAGGWGGVIEKFEKEYVSQLSRYPMRHLVLLFDFDRDTVEEDRVVFARSKIPESLANRVFVLGVWSKPEKLKTALRHTPAESIGKRLADDCRSGTSQTWEHELLKHNLPEVERLRKSVAPILFQHTPPIPVDFKSCDS